MFVLETTVIKIGFRRILNVSVFWLAQLFPPEIKSCQCTCSFNINTPANIKARDSYIPTGLYGLIVLTSPISRQDYMV